MADDDAPHTPDTRGPAVVLWGTLQSGVKDIIGPFASVDEGCRWAVERTAAMGAVTVLLLTPPDEFRFGK